MNHNESSISHRLDDAFRDVAEGVVDVPNPAQLRTLAHPNEHRHVSVHLSSRGVQVMHRPSQGAAYKPTHGGYPSAGARA